MKPDKPLESRKDFPHFRSMPTRWMDNDIYGHVNNVQYYSFFDTLVNAYMIEAGALDIHGGGSVGFVVETSCRYHKSFSFPQVIEGGLRVARIGSSSVRYEIGLFLMGDAEPAATGFFVHVYVDRANGRPCPIPETARRAMEAIQVPGAP